VLLTIQVDSVEKSNENDGRIPPNVRQAINFCQSDGLVHDRSLTEAADPATLSQPTREIQSPAPGSRGTPEPS
jgi:hypothetical protein